jgi:hypothetical protein
MRQARSPGARSEDAISSTGWTKYRNYLKKAIVHTMKFMYNEESMNG